MNDTAQTEPVSSQKSIKTVLYIATVVQVLVLLWYGDICWFAWILLDDPMVTTKKVTFYIFHYRIPLIFTTLLLGQAWYVFGKKRFEKALRKVKNIVLVWAIMPVLLFLEILFQ